MGKGTVHRLGQSTVQLVLCLKAKVASNVDSDLYYCVDAELRLASL